MGKVVVALFVAWVLAGIFWSLEELWPNDETQPRWRNDSKTDIAYALLGATILKPLRAVCVGVVVFIVFFLSGMPLRPGAMQAWLERETWTSSLPIAVQAGLVLFLGGFISYWLHRLAHRRTLWRVHSVHHSSARLDWLSSVRVHPLDMLLSRTVHAALLVPFGFDFRVLAAYAPLLGIYALFLHANVPWNYGPLRYVIASPAFHRFHHSSEPAAQNKNFSGLFPIFDLVFGTFYMPKHRALEIGAGEPVPRGILAQLAHPFRPASR
jgi:sterol desaturase/sphingolipid hydroxylase (fatty acid hydroxylase superfamily)